MSLEALQAELEYLDLLLTSARETRDYFKHVVGRKATADRAQRVAAALGTERIRVVRALAQLGGEGIT